MSLTFASAFCKFLSTSGRLLRFVRLHKKQIRKIKIIATTIQTQAELVESSSVGVGDGLGDGLGVLHLLEYTGPPRYPDMRGRGLDRTPHAILI